MRHHVSPQDKTRHTCTQPPPVLLDREGVYLGLNEALLLHEGGALGPLLLALTHTAAQHLDLLDHLQQGALYGDRL